MMSIHFGFQGSGFRVLGLFVWMSIHGCREFARGSRGGQWKRAIIIMSASCVIMYEVYIERTQVPEGT